MPAIPPNMSPSETSYATGTTTYAYSTGSRHLLTTETDALGETSTYAYDSLGHLTTATNRPGPSHVIWL